MERRGYLVFVVAMSMAACGGGEKVAAEGREAPPPAGGGGGGASSGASGGEGSSGGGASSSGGSSGAPAPSPSVDTTRISLTVAGDARGALVAVPKSYDASKTYPLVIVLHGDGKDGATFRSEMTVDGATADRAIVVYPDGVGGTWNLYGPVATNPDDAFIAALVTDVSNRWHVDTARTFGAGFSSGAFMVSQLACRNPSLFRAIAVHSGGAPSEPQDPSAGTWPNGFAQCPNQSSGVAALVIHGTSDTVVGYESGNYAARYWAYVDGCTEARADTTPAPCQRHAGCPSSKPVVFCPVNNLGHAVWSDAARTVAEFFLGM